MIDDAFNSPKKEMIDDIVQVEWEMFQEVQGLNGRALCQDDLETFKIMRFSNYAPWPEAILLSYQHDLARAKEDGRNLLLEKYGYMMSLSDPTYYQKELADALPQPNAFTMKMIREIVAYLLDCERQLQEQYPKLSAKGRKLNSSRLDRHFASIETYATGELRTYSPSTLRLLLDFIRIEKSLGHSIALDIRTAMVKLYGYQSLAEAEQKL